MFNEIQLITFTNLITQNKSVLGSLYECRQISNVLIRRKLHLHLYFRNTFKCNFDKSFKKDENEKEVILMQKYTKFLNCSTTSVLSYVSQMNSAILTILIACLLVTFTEAGKWKISGKLSYSGYKGWGGSVGVSFSWRKKRRSPVSVS